MLLMPRRSGGSKLAWLPFSASWWLQTTLPLNRVNLGTFFLLVKYAALKLIDTGTRISNHRQIYPYTKYPPNTTTWQRRLNSGYVDDGLVSLNLCTERAKQVDAAIIRNSLESLRLNPYRKWQNCTLSPSVIRNRHWIANGSSAMRNFTIVIALFCSVTSIRLHLIPLLTGT